MTKIETANGASHCDGSTHIANESPLPPLLGRKFSASARNTCAVRHDESKSSAPVDRAACSLLMRITMNTRAFHGRTANIARGMAVAIMATGTACGTNSGFETLAQSAETPAQPPGKTSLAMPKQLRAAYIASVQSGASEAYSARIVDGITRLENPAQRFVTTVDSQGLVVIPHGEAWRLSMRTTAVGCADAMVPMTQTESQVAANRAKFSRVGLEEWYLNGPLGVEQGFVLPKAPTCAGPKRITMAIEGDLSATLDDADGDGRGERVRFFDPNGRVALAYTDLFVTDASGKTIPAWLSVGAQEMAIVVDDAAATYPLSIDPLILVLDTKLVASDGMPSDYFGNSVSLSGTTALIGAPMDGDLGEFSGSAYVFVQSGNAWIQQAKLLASDGMPSDLFGNAVSLSGNTALVAAPARSNQAMQESGAVYVFVRSGNTWTQQAELFANDGADFDHFGTSVSLSGDTALVSVVNDLFFSPGAAYVFVRSGTTWTQSAKLSASDGFGGDGFGQAVSLAKDTAVIGAEGMGSAHVFVRNGATWTHQANLWPDDAGVAGGFGHSVFVDGDTALVGASYAGGLGMDSGSAYVFVRGGDSWTQQAKLLASDGMAHDMFGSSVSLEGDTALVGAPGNPSVGAAYVFVRSGHTWTEYAKVLPNSASPSGFGASVSQSGRTALIGAPTDQPLGAAYSLSLPKTNGEACSTPTECANQVCIAGFCGNLTGSPCASGADCKTGFCTDGFCCNSSCGDNDASDCQVCSEAAGAVKNGTCTPVAKGTVCRSAMGVCDVLEVCTGVDGTCPTDIKVAAGTECRASEGVCTAAEKCDGKTNDCPADVDLPNGSLCPGGLCAGKTCVLDPPKPIVEENACTCRAAGSSSTPASFAAFGLLGLGLLLARRQRSNPDRAPRTRERLQ